MKYFFWKLANYYGLIMGWPLFAPIHKAIVIFALHGLGYDNAHYSGERRFLKLLKSKNVRVALDVGANVGSYSEDLVAIVGCRVYSIEPAHASFVELQKRASTSNGLIIPLNYAVSDSDSVAKLYSRSATCEKASLHDDGETSVVQEVAVKTLDSIVGEQGNPQIDFVKIDIEGFEREALRGMTFAPRFIQFEFNGHHVRRGVTLKSIVDQVPSGYSVVRLLPHGMIPVRDDAHIDNIFMFSNYVAYKNGELVV